MNTIRPYVPVFARFLVVLVFVMNGLGIVDPSAAIHDMAARGIPAHMAPALSIGGRILQVFASMGLALGLYPEICAVALIAFLIPATLIAHPFWIAPSHLFQVQLINFLKNVSMIGGLLFIASMNSQPTSVEHRPAVVSRGSWLRVLARR